MLKAAAVEVAVLGMAQLHSGVGTSQPALVVELMIVDTVYLRAQLIGLQEVHACLQGYVSLLAWAHPRGMAEGDALERNVAYRSVGSAHKLYQCLDDGHHGPSLVLHS